MTKEVAEKLMIVYNTLNVVTVTGRDNLVRVSGCMQIIEDLLKEVETDGNANPEQQIHKT